MNLADIYAADERLKPYLSPTPLILSSLLKRELNRHIWLKLETQQPTGSFKPRPAFNGILSQLDAAKAQGVIASSSGNFAQGVAYAARELGIHAVIVMTKNSSPFKIERTKRLGAEVVLCENTLEDRINTTLTLQKKTGRVLLHPYNSVETIAGDGTIGLELHSELGDKLNHMAILIPVGGGGLIAGIGFTLKTLSPGCKIIGVQPKQNASLAKSLAANQCIDVGPVETKADALVASSPGEIAFDLIRQHIDEIVLVDEKEIQTATQFLIEQHKLVVEPGGAVTIAALLAEKVTPSDSVCILSGGNIQLL